jgi:hypothetical protein
VIAGYYLIDLTPPSSESAALARIRVAVINSPYRPRVSALTKVALYSQDRLK